MKHLKVWIAILLAGVMLFTPVVTHAAPRMKYVTDVVVSYGDSFDDAVQWLKNNGYKDYVDADLNEDSASVFDKDRAVVLGYKTSYDPAEAITDLSLMYMGGGYSYTSYQDMLDKQEKEIGEFIAQFTAALAEYRANFADGKQKAINAYNLLNEFVDDDTGMKLGDLFLNPLKEEMGDEAYNALSDEEKKLHGDFTTMSMQGNALAVIAVKKAIAIATDTAEDSWLDRLSKIGPYGLSDQMMESGLTSREALAELALTYSDTANDLLAMWPDLEQLISIYESTGLTAESTPEEIDAFFAEHQNLKVEDWASVVSFYDTLAATPYGDEGDTLLDLFKIPYAEFSADEGMMEQLYNIASVLSEGQKSCLGFSSFAELINMGIVGNDAAAWETGNADAMDLADIQTEETELGEGSKEPMSIFSGVDRTLYEGDIALTNAAMVKEAKSNSSIYDGHMYGVNLVKLRNILFAVGLGCAAAALAVKKIVIPAIKSSVANKLTSANFARIEELGGSVTTKAGAWSKAAKGLSVAAVLMCAAGIAVSVADLIKYYDNDFTPIPDKIVEEVLPEGADESIYVYYRTAMCNRTEKYGVSEVLGDDNDLHADLGKAWLSLYYTKDPRAGKPVTADFVVGSDGNVQGYKPLHMFSESSPVNLADPRWSYTDELWNTLNLKNTPTIYFYYGVDQNATLAGSVFSGGTLAIFIGAGVLIGVVAGVALSSIKSKRKRENEGANA